MVNTAGLTLIGARVRVVLVDAPVHGCRDHARRHLSPVAASARRKRLCPGGNDQRTLARRVDEASETGDRGRPPRRGTRCRPVRTLCPGCELLRENVGALGHGRDAHRARGRPGQSRRRVPGMVEHPQNPTSAKCRPLREVMSGSTSSGSLASLRDLTGLTASQTTPSPGDLLWQTRLGRSPPFAPPSRTSRRCGPLSSPPRRWWSQTRRRRRAPRRRSRSLLPALLRDATDPPA